MIDTPDEFDPDLDTDLDTDEPEPEHDVDGGSDDAGVAEPPHPVNWNLLTAHEAEIEWLELNRWVHWLRHTYGLPASVIPPFWHHHPELVWELSALHLHWLCAYDPEQNGSATLLGNHTAARPPERVPVGPPHRPARARGRCRWRRAKQTRGFRAWASQSWRTPRGGG